MSYEFNDQEMLLTSIAKACTLVNDRVQTRLPIKCSLLEVLLFELERIYSDQFYLQILHKTIFIIAYYGLFRIGELTLSEHVVKAAHVSIGKNKDKFF